MTRKKLNIIMFIITFILLCLIIICLVYMDDIRSALKGQPQSQTGEEYSQNTLPQTSSDTLTEIQPTTQQPTFATVETTAAATVETTEATTEPTTVPTTEPETVPESDPDIGETVAEVVRQQIGKPYQYGGVGPDSFDTSGLVQYCYKQAGVSVPRSNSALADFGYQVGKDEMRPGDAVFFWSKEPGVPEYLGIYVGDGMVVAAMNPSKPIVEFNMNSAYYTEHFVFIRRFY